MHRRFLRLLLIAAALMLVVLGVMSCAPAAPATQEAAATEAPATEAPTQEAATEAPTEEAATEAPAAGEPIKVGLSFSDFATERWQNEEILMRGLLEDLGYEVLSQEANHDVQLQNDQIDNMVAQGARALIVIAEDGDAAVTATDRAAEAGVIVLAYDRLIKSPNIAAYLSFNNVEVGRQQALGVMAAIDAENWDVAANGPARVVKLGGSPTDNNAVLVRQGQDSVLDPLEQAGKIEIVADQWVDNWDAANALALMENILAAAGNDVDAVVASNDGTALGALQALSAQGLAGTVPISGQDATADGANSIVKGELTVTVMKDIRDLGPLAVELIDGLLKGQTVELENYPLDELTGDASLTGEVPCKFLPVVQVNADNVYDLVVVSGFQAYDDVYRDIPEDQRPPRPDLEN
jgi:D-xylose transport system substrate-binding protein